MLKRRISDIGSRGILLFSGGFDSTLTAFLLKKAGKHIVSLSINYLNRPPMEIKATYRLLEALHITDQEWVDISIGSNIAREIPGSDHEGWFPYRNIIFFAIASHLAANKDIDFIAAGHRAWDSIFNDALPQYFEQLGDILRFSGQATRDRECVLYLPLIDSDEPIRQTLRHDEEARQLVNLSWSCWRRGNTPCGECGPCKAREEYLKELFQRA